MPVWLSLLLCLVLRPEAAAASVLHAWDERRSAAYAAGEPAALRPLYAPGSATGRADRRMLRAYAGRGLRVTGLRTQLLAVDVLADPSPRSCPVGEPSRAGRRVEGCWVLRVTDRVVGGVARGRGGPVVLPRDRPSTWRVVLAPRRGGWVVAQVRQHR